MPHSLFDTDGDRLIITATAPLARALQRAYGERQMAAARRSWPTGPIRSLPVWLSEVWRETQQVEDRAFPILLSRTQESTLWERCLERVVTRRSRALPVLMHADSAARKAVEAHTLLTEFQAEDAFLASPVLSLNDDAELFRRWLEEFNTQLNERQWMVAGRLAAPVLERIRNGVVALPPEVLFAGFTLVSPLVRELSKALQGRGVSTRFYAPTRSSSPVRVALESPDHELERAVGWAVGIAEREPGAHVALVLPDLNKHTHAIGRLLDDFVGPRGYELERNATLAERPIVRDALEALGLTRSRHALAVWEHHVRSPFFAGAESEALARERIARALRLLGEVEFAIAHVRRVAREVDSQGSKVLQLEAMMDHARDLPVRQSTADWAQTFSTHLRHCGWPGDRPLSPEEQQALEGFSAALGELAGLNMTIGTVSREVALARLGQIVRNLAFRSPMSARAISVIALDEAVGREFSHVWVCGLHDEVWPTPSTPNPFLPGKLQRAFSMPRSAPEWELAYAEETMSQLAHSAEVVVFSHPLFEADRRCAPSALLNGYPAVSPCDLMRSTRVARHQQLRRAVPILDSLADYRAPFSQSKHLVRGGTGILKNQAACPFKAFATHRLGANALGIPVAGLDSRDRGVLAHEILDHVWQTLGTHSRLVASTEEALEALVADAVDGAVKARIRQRPVTLQSAFAGLERERQTQIVLRWLALEKTRPPFVVRQVERSLTTEVGGLSMRLRIDRIDELSDGSCLIIDYKTGKPKLSDLEGDRPREPQLPVYGLALEDAGEAFHGLAFGVVRHDKVEFQGMTVGCAGPGVKSLGEDPEKGARLWAEKRAHWRVVLMRLAKAFVSGDAVVDPKDAQTCRLCDLSGLCRIAELRDSGHGDLFDD